MQLTRCGPPAIARSSACRSAPPQRLPFVLAHTSPAPRLVETRRRSRPPTNTQRGRQCTLPAAVADNAPPPDDLSSSHRGEQHITEADLAPVLRKAGEGNFRQAIVALTHLGGAKLFGPAWAALASGVIDHVLSAIPESADGRLAREESRLASAAELSQLIVAQLRRPLLAFGLLDRTASGGDPLVDRECLEELFVQLIRAMHSICKEYQLPAAPRVQATEPRWVQTHRRFRKTHFEAADYGAPPVAFSGRQQELAQLDEWLADEAAPPRFLITAPAGRGKSALLAHWQERLRLRGIIAPDGTAEAAGWRLVFVPISQSLNTNRPDRYLADLSQQLSCIIPDALPAPSAERAYRDQAELLLDSLADTNRRVLLVIDGLDESLGDFDARVLPPRLPPNLRIVASARLTLGDADARGWLETLAWDTRGSARYLELSVLGEREIAAAIEQVGAPIQYVADDPTLLKRLAELTLGEPLTLTYYLQDLWRSATGGERITLQTLDGLQPGFHGYFKNALQLETQALKEAREPCGPEVLWPLYILASAYGPLEEDDLVALAPLVDPTLKLSLASQWLRPVRRFIRGTGTAQTGYVLAHPKIGDYLKEREAASVRRATRAIVSWGRNILRDSESGSQVPPYLLHHLRLHFEQDDAPEGDLLALTENRWRRAWLKLEGGLQGFTTDVRAVAAHLRKDPLDHVAGLVRCALILRSLDDIGERLPAQVLRYAAERGVLAPSAAVHLAELAEDEGAVEAVVCGLIARLKPGHMECAGYLHELLAALLRIVDERSRSAALKHLALGLDSSHATAARSVARSIRDEDLRNEVLQALGSKGQQLKTAHETLASVGVTEDRALGDAAPRRGWRPPEEPKVDSVATALSLPTAGERRRAFRRMAGDLDEDELREALTHVFALPSGLEVYNGVEALAPRMPEALLDQVLENLRAFDDSGLIGADLLQMLAYRLSERQLKRAAAIAGGIPDDEYRFRAQHALVIHAQGEVQTEMIATALRTASEIDNEHVRATSLRLLIAHVPASLMEETLTLIGHFVREDYGSEVLVAAAEHIPQGQLDRAVAMATAMTCSKARSLAMNALAPRMTSEQLDKSVRSSLTGGRNSGLCRLLGALTPLAVGELREEVCREAARLARLLTDTHERGMALAALVPCVRREAFEAMLNEAVAVANAVDGDWERSEVLAALSPFLTGEQKRAAISAIEASFDRRGRVIALTGLAKRLTALERRTLQKEITEVGDAFFGALALGRLARHSEPTLRRAAVAQALKMLDTEQGDPEGRLLVLRMLAPLAEGEQRHELLVEVTESAKRGVALEWGLDLVARTITPDQQVSVLGAILDKFDRIPPSRLLCAFAALLPVIQNHGGDEAVREVARAALDVAAWHQPPPGPPQTGRT